MKPPLARETVVSLGWLIAIWFSTAAVYDVVEPWTPHNNAAPLAAGAWVVATVAWLVVRARRRQAIRPLLLAAALCFMALTLFVLAWVVALKFASPHWGF